MIPIIDYWGYWPTPTDGSRIDVRSYGEPWGGSTVR